MVFFTFKLDFKKAMIKPLNGSATKGLGFFIV
jgi:hypothetical protein